MEIKKTSEDSIPIPKSMGPEDIIRYGFLEISDIIDGMSLSNLFPATKGTNPYVAPDSDENTLPSGIRKGRYIQYICTQRS